MGGSWENMRIMKRRRDGVRQHYHVKLLANKIVRRLKPYSSRITIAGSLRRHAPANDIDLVVIPKDKDKIRSELSRLGKIEASGDQQVFANIDGTKVDVFYANKDDYGAQLLSRTGPAGSSISNRQLARRKGMLLNQYGLFKGRRRIATTEPGIYHALGKPFRKPENRGKSRNFGFWNKDEQGASSRYEIKRSVGERGKKSKILKAIEGIEENLKVPDISPERRQQLEIEKASLENRAKRITGLPPVEVVRTGSGFLEIGNKVIDRYAGKSGPRPEWVQELGEIPSTPEIIKQAQKRSTIERIKDRNRFIRTRDILSDPDYLVDEEGEVYADINLEDIAWKKKGKHQRRRRR
jgi:hypothetical protein